MVIVVADDSSCVAWVLGGFVSACGFVVWLLWCVVLPAVIVA